MKLLQISIEVNSGSVGRIAEQIGQVVLERGWESHITYARNNNPSKSQVIKIGNKFDIYTHGIETRIFDNHCLSSTTSTRDLVERIKEINPDIIHLHHLHGYFINMEVLFDYLKESKIPVVWTFHDCWAFTGHCVHFDFVGCNKWKTQCYDCEQKKEYPASLLFDRSRQNYIDKERIFNLVQNLTIVSVSKWLSEKVSESFLKNHESRIIYNGVDLERFYPKDSRDKIDALHGTKDKFLLLGVATTWDSRKRLVDFIELCDSLNDTFAIILIGLSNEQIRKLPAKIIGLSRTENQDELCDFYSASDLYLNLSVEETFGLTTAEALACGTPSIVYNSTACPELIDDNTGFIVEKLNINELVDKINMAKTIGKYSFSQSCRNRAVELFNKKERFLEYFNLYNEILNKNGQK